MGPQLLATCLEGCWAHLAPVSWFFFETSVVTTEVPLAGRTQAKPFPSLLFLKQPESELPQVLHIF